MIPWLDSEAPGFPPVSQALAEPNGLLAAGGSLSPSWLICAYSKGIFPWFSEGQPILWWSPDPRMILVPGEVRITRSLHKTLRSGQFELRADTAFADVVRACAGARRNCEDTWIRPAMVEAYCRMHELGWAHSIETWQDGHLVGGLYGIALGKVFFGESMFHRVSNASKVALVHLARALERRNFAMIDCQMSTPHLATLGGRDIPRTHLLECLASWAQPDALPARWQADFLLADWSV